MKVQQSKKLHIIAPSKWNVSNLWGTYALKDNLYRFFQPTSFQNTTNLLYTILNSEYQKCKRPWKFHYKLLLCYPKSFLRSNSRTHPSFSISFVQTCYCLSTPLVLKDTFYLKHPNFKANYPMFGLLLLLQSAYFDGKFGKSGSTFRFILSHLNMKFFKSSSCGDSSKVCKSCAKN